MYAGSHLVLLIIAAVGSLTTSQRSGIVIPEPAKISPSVIQFSCDWLKALSSIEKKKNLFFSPVSMGVALSILQQGSRGRTQEEITNALNVGPSDSREGFQYLAESIKHLSPTINSTILWGGGAAFTDEVTVDENFKKRATENYGVNFGEISTYNFKNVEAAIKLIVDEMANITQNHVPHVIEPHLIDDALGVVYNAVYFKGFWREAFPKEKTALGKFYLNDEESVDVPFMSITIKTEVYNDTDLKLTWIRLPYVDPEFSMLLALPHKRFEVEELIERLTAVKLTTSLVNARTKNVHIRLPSFKLMKHFHTKRSLKIMSVTELFNRAADLSGMIRVKEGENRTKIKEIVHDAFIEVDESGSKMGSDSLEVTKCEESGGPDVSFHADQPFLFNIMNNVARVPFFVGKVVNPTEH